MNKEKENLSLQQAFLSDVELYYSDEVAGDVITISGEEHHHIKNVMRHEAGDEIYITDGKGNIYKSSIIELGKKNLSSKVLSSTFYENKYSKITFCIPRLRNADRFEFALEKCVELGITSFIVFDSKRSVAKGEKIDRWQKILTSAMKQSLRAWLPGVVYKKNLEEIAQLDGMKILFDQNADEAYKSILNSELLDQNCFFIFGPEGGMADEELKVMSIAHKVRLTENRLRSETAIIAAATELVFTTIQ